MPKQRLCYSEFPAVTQAVRRARRWLKTATLAERFEIMVKAGLCTREAADRALARQTVPKVD